MTATAAMKFKTVPQNEKEAQQIIGAELGNYAPREIILDMKADRCRSFCEFAIFRCNCMITGNRGDLFQAEKAMELATLCFGEDKVKSLPRATLSAIGALLGYLKETQKVDPTFLRELHIYTGEQHMELDLSTFRNLELLESMRDREKKGSLLWVLDNTCTAMGARELRSWIRQPLRQVAAICARQRAVGELAGNFSCREELKERLGRILDIERLTAKAVYGTANARDLRSLADSLRLLPEIKDILLDTESSALQSIWLEMDPLTDIFAALDRAIVENPPLTIREAGMFQEGYNQDADMYRSMRTNAQGWLKEVEAKEIQLTGIRGLKIGYNKVFGYYLEVTKSQIDLVPRTYIRKQTLTNCERYITEELKQLESTILGAWDSLCALEYELFCALRDFVAKESERIQKTASQLATLDVLLSLGEVAAKNNYVCPDVDDSDIIDIRDGRHPVVEKFTSDSYFVPNDTHLDTAAHRMMLITGPNMAGKSTYMRQVALIVLMAQIGSFVPATSAHIGVVDRLFTRVGASDDLASGQSTFMLEMNEVANILKRATKRSLIIYDEVGRGTSTYDGMSIARAVVEYTASKKIGARTMFATHYHELTSMEGECDGVINFHIAAKKRNDDIIFLRKIVRGATDDSYGIEVAKLAGVPTEVVKRAREVLTQIEKDGMVTPAPKSRPTTVDMGMPDLLATLQKSEAEEVAEELKRADLNTLTPLEAMNLLFQLKKKLITE